MNAFDNIIGYNYVKQDLAQICDVLQNPEVYATLGATTPKGLLLHGEPGVGKTLMATSLIAASGRPAFTCRKDKSGSDFIKVIRENFVQAKDNAPSIVFLDDMDKFANSDFDLTDAEEYVTIQSCIDELTGCEVFVLATANDIRKLPRSLLRAGRFDRVMEITAPRGADAEKIIEHYLQQKHFVGDLDIKVMAAIMADHSCAELETVINAAALLAGYERSERITERHFMEAYLRTCFDIPANGDEEEEDNSRLGLSALNKKQKLQHIACHEAGHAVTAELLCPGCVTLVSTRGDSKHFGGFTSFNKNVSEDAFTWEERQIISVLGGRAAMEQRYGVLDLGSSADLHLAFGAVKNLIRRCCICGFRLHGGEYQNSQTLLAMQEEVVAAEIEKYYHRAKELLATNRELFDRVEQELIEKDVLTSKDLQRIRSECGVLPMVE